MDPFTSLKQSLADELELRLDGVCVSGEYPAAYGPMPERYPMLAVGIGQVDFTGSENRVGILLRFDILCPVSQKGGCHGIFDQLCTILLETRGRFGVSDVSCGEVEYLRDWDMLRLTATAKMQGLLFTETEESQGPEFEDLRIYLKGDTGL